jgi:hypothetical protein
MWVLYKTSEFCYIYLANVAFTSVNFDFLFFKSRWFSRGWTLQELIAPFNVVLYSMDWEELATKFTLRGIIIATTGVERDSLFGGDLGEVSVAQKMPSASKRETSRIED